MRRWMVGSVGAALAATALVACGSEGARMVADAMVDAADRLHDAGVVLDAMGDTAVSDAQAGDSGRGPAAVVSVDCDTEHTFRREEGDMAAGNFVEQTAFTAEADIPAAAADGSSTVHAFACDREEFGPVTPPDGCGTDDTCTGSSVPPPIACVTMSGVEVEAGRVRLRCGYRTRSRLAIPGPDLGDEVVSGFRWQRVVFRVD